MAAHKASSPLCCVAELTNDPHDGLNHDELAADTLIMSLVFNSLSDPSAEINTRLRLITGHISALYFFISWKNLKMSPKAGERHRAPPSPSPLPPCELGSDSETSDF